MIDPGTGCVNNLVIEGNTLVSDALSGVLVQSIKLARQAFHRITGNTIEPGGVYPGIIIGYHEDEVPGNSIPNPDDLVVADNFAYTGGGRANQRGQVSYKADPEGDGTNIGSYRALVWVAHPDWPDIAGTGSGAAGWDTASEPGAESDSRRP